MYLKTLAPVLVVTLAVATGCAKNGKAKAAKGNGGVPLNSAVTDISPRPAVGPADSTYAPPVTAGAYAAAPASGWGAASPAAYEPAMTQTPATPIGAAPALGAGTYTIKKGDTFYRIARERYGDPKQWNRIASANPGVTPNTLKVGQTIVVP